MICFRDMTFCGFYKDCASAGGCHRPLTPEVQAAAKAWWGSDEAPIAQFAEKPRCWTEKAKALSSMDRARGFYPRCPGSTPGGVAIVDSRRNGDAAVCKTAETEFNSQAVFQIGQVAQR